MEPRLIIAYTLLALLVLAAAVGLGLVLTVGRRRLRKDRRRELARRARWTERTGLTSD